VHVVSTLQSTTRIGGGVSVTSAQEISVPYADYRTIRSRLASEHYIALCSRASFPELI